ncbi:hypothetical protein [Achromobacter pestifer]|uniref:Uncharacterized protein n=1 Tax=Achromobacter pestifer TaxID=1353889 RepID=A0A6S6YQ86_9BURK|nr:hypothetical protein [Achromobacter pestifer]CAB3636023.1 hypothetical protein LMG3431_01591 [Achromobacter pestifer]
MKMRCALPFAILLLATSAAQADPLDAFYQNPIYRTGDDPKSCQTLPGGLPRKMGVTEDTRTVAKVHLSGRAVTVMWTDEEGGLRSSYFYLRKEDCDWLELQIAPPALRVDPDKYVADLKAKYDKRIHFQTPHAEKVVREYRLECPLKPQRYVPLTSLLYSSLSSIDRPKSWLEIIVEDDDGNIRIINDFRGPSVPPGANDGPERNGPRIDRSGKITMRNTSIVDTACGGYMGPIWRDK